MEERNVGALGESGGVCGCVGTAAEVVDEVDFACKWSVDTGLELMWVCGVPLSSKS